MGNNVTTYAEVSLDKTTILSYPVFQREVENNCATDKLYLPIKSVPLPPVPEYYFEQEVLTIREDHVYKHYDIKPIPIDQLFKLFPPNLSKSELTIYSGLIRQIGHLTELHFITYMNDLIQSKYIDSYTDLQCPLSWILADDTVKEHKVVKEYYYNTAMLIKSYFKNVELGREVLPKSIEDINSKIPEFKWPD